MHRPLLRFLPLLLAVLGLAPFAFATGNVTLTSGTFTAAQSGRSYMDIGGVWNGSARVDTAGTGDGITLVFQNTGSTTAFDFAPTITLPSGFTRLGSVTVSASSGSPTVSGTPATTGTIAVNLTGFDLAAGATLTLVYQVGAGTTVAAGDYALGSSWTWAESNGGAQGGAVTGSQTVTTKAGAYSLAVSPGTMSLAVNQSGTFRYKVTNTGAGGLFNFTLDETQSGTSWQFNSSAVVPTPPPTVTVSGVLATIPYLAPGETFSVDVTGTVTDCLNINNNIAVTHLLLPSPGLNSITPVTLNLQVPLVDFTAGNITLNYGTTTPVSIPINNTGLGVARGVITTAPSRAIKLHSNFNALGLTVGGLAANWAYDAASGTFSYTGNSATIPNNGSTTLTFTLRPADFCAGAPAGTIQYSMEYEDGCGDLYVIPVKFATLATTTVVPSVGLAMTGNGSRLGVGLSGHWTVTLSAANPSLISSANVIVTDTLPAGLSNIVLTTSAGTATRSGTTITWTVPKANLGSNQTLGIDFIAPVDPCTGGNSITNNAAIAAPNAVTTTAGCALTAAAANTILLTNAPAATVTQSFNVTPAADGTFETGAASADAVRDPGEGEFIPCQADYTINATYPGTWAGSTYQDNYGGVTQTTLVPGTLQVAINGGAYTAVPAGSVTTSSGSLALDLSFLAGAAYYNTAGVSDPVNARTLSLRYKLTATDAAVASANPRAVTAIVQLKINSGAGAGACNAGQFSQGDFYNLARAAGTLGVAITGPVTTCDTFPLVLTAGNATPETIANVLVSLATHTASGDYRYVTGQTPTYGGVFSSGNITVAENGGEVPTFTFTGGKLTGTGTITVLVKRVGASTTPSALGATMAYDDNQTQAAATRAFNTTASATPALVRKGTIQLIVTPQNVVVYDTSVSWIAYLTNGGSGTAFSTELIDKFPLHVTPDIPGMVAANAGIGLAAGDITSTYDAGTQVWTVTVQLGGLASGATKKVIMVGAIDGVSCNFPSLANAISVHWGCNGEYIQDEQYVNPSFSQPPPQVAISHLGTSVAKLCDTGTVDLIISNSGNSTVYQNKVMEVINPATTGFTLVPGSVQYALNGGAFNAASASFNPTGTGTTADPYVWTSTQIPELATLVTGSAPSGTNRIQIRYGVTASETAYTSTPTLRASSASKIACGDTYTNAGTNYTLAVQKPSLSVVKVGINRTVAGGSVRTGNYGATVNAGTGDALEWRVQITNSGNFEARNVRLRDLLSGSGGAVNLTNSSGTVLAATYNSGDWVTIPNLASGATVTYYFNETVGNTCTSANDTASVTWGCVSNGATAASNLSTAASSNNASLNTVPSVVATTANGAALENGRYKHDVRLTNTGGHATGVTFALTLPSGVDLDTSASGSPLNTPISDSRFTTNDTSNPSRYTSYTITAGPSPANYTITFNGPAAPTLRSGNRVVATLYYLPRGYSDTAANPAAPANMAAVGGFLSPETTANGLDPAVPGNAATITPGYRSTCGNTYTGTPLSTTLTLNSPDLDITVNPNPEQISAATAPYTFVFNYLITNNSSASSTANKIQFRLPTVGPDWISVSAALTTPGIGGSAVTTTNAANNYLIDTASFGTLSQNQTAVVQVTVTTKPPTGPTPYTDPNADDLLLVGEIVGHLYDQSGADTGINYSLDRAAPRIFDTFTVSGYLYVDSNHNAGRDPAETSKPSGTYFAKIISAATPAGPAYAASAALTSTGYYEFTGNIPQGNYNIIIDDNATLSDVTPTTISNNLGTEMPGLKRPVTIGTTSILNQNFGQFPGSRYTGVVFADAGTGGGTANNGIRDGAEPGIGGALVKAFRTTTGSVSDTTTTAADGTYTLWVATSSIGAGNGMSVAETNVSGYVSTGATFPASATYSLATDTIAYFHNGGVDLGGFNFADVPPNTFVVDSARTITSGSVTFYPHVYTAATTGKVSFSTSATSTYPGWTQLLYRDDNCNGILDPGETTVILPATSFSVTAGQTVCLILKQASPPGITAGVANSVAIAASFSALNGAATVFTNSLTNTDVTTIGSPVIGGLELLKEQVLDANCDATETTGFTINPLTSGAVPGACIKYRLTYKNSGDSPLSTIEILDTTPAFTTFVSATYDPPPAALGATVTLTNPIAGATGSIKWKFTGSMNPGTQGVVYFTVRVQQ